MASLTRTLVDKFSLENAVSFEELEANKSHQEFLEKNIIKMEEIFKGYPKIILNARKQELFLNGVKLTFKNENRNLQYL